MVKFIPIEPTHVDFVYTCITELENHVFDRDQFDLIYNRNLESGTAFGFVLEWNNEQAGYMSVHIQSLLHHCALVAEIQELVILPGFRNNKIGEQALEFAVEFAREKGCELIELACNLKRINAHRFYLKNKFNQTHYKFTFPLTPNGIQK